MDSTVHSKYNSLSHLSIHELSSIAVPFLAYKESLPMVQALFEAAIVPKIVNMLLVVIRH